MSASRAFAVIDVFEFSDPQQEARYKHFISVLRCPKCQNQNLAGSDSAISGDLRKELYRLLEEGSSDEEIIRFMTERYGDFVLYDPPVRKETGLLWFAPLFLFLAGLVFVFFHIRSRSASDFKDNMVSLTDAEKEQLEKLTGSNKGGHD